MASEPTERSPDNGTSPKPPAEETTTSRLSKPVEESSRCYRPYCGKVAFILSAVMICVFAGNFMYHWTCSDIHVFTWIAAFATFGFVYNIFWILFFRPNLHDFKILLPSNEHFLCLPATPRNEILNDLNMSFDLRRSTSHTSLKSSLYESGEFLLTPHLPIESISDMRKIRSASNQQFMTSMLHLGSAMWVVIGVHAVYELKAGNLINVDYSSYDSRLLEMSAYLIMAAGMGGIVFTDIPNRISLSLPKMFNQISFAVHVIGVSTYANGSNLAYAVYTKGSVLSIVFLSGFAFFTACYYAVKFSMPRFHSDARLVHRLSVFYIMTELMAILTCVVAGLLVCYNLGNHSSQCSDAKSSSCERRSFEQW